VGNFKRKYWVILLLLLLLLLGGVGAWFFGPDPKVAKAKQIMKELSSEEGRKLSRDERRKKRNELRGLKRSLKPEQRRELVAERRKKKNEELKRYFSLAPAAKTKYLDEYIKKMEKRRKAQEQRQRKANGGNGEASSTQGSQTNHPGRQKRSQMSPQEKEDHMKQRLDEFTPEERALRYQFRQDVKNRMAQLGLSTGPKMRGR
jgi:hypothetical protein